MIIAMIKGFTRVCGKAQGYMGLPIRDTAVVDKAQNLVVNRMETAWTPTPDELERLNKGANVIVSIFGNTPAPMLLTVDDELPEQPCQMIMIRLPAGYASADEFMRDCGLEPD